MSASTPRVEFDKDEDSPNFTLTVISDGVRFQVYMTPGEVFELVNTIQRTTQQGASR